MRLNPRQFFFVMIAVTVLSFGGIVGAFYWGNKQLQNKANSLSELLTDNDIAQTKITALSKANQSAELAEETSTLLKTLLPNEKQQEKLVADILYTASFQAGIPISQLGSITFDGSGESSDLSGTEEAANISGVYTYPFSLSISDISYTTLLNLLEQIETNGRLVQIDNLQITPDKAIPGKIKSVSLSLKAFLKP